VAAGELVVVLGPSGCGKTTLLKTVNRLCEPSSGRIYLNGTDIRTLRVTQLRRRMGYVIQQGGLFPHMTVAQNVAVVPRLLGWSRARQRARTEQLLGWVQLPPREYRHRYPAQLSGGQRQRVGIARALAGDPGVLLMDEPFGALDAITRRTLQQLVRALQQQLPKTVLFVSHDVAEAFYLADRVLVLRQGQIEQFDTPPRLLAAPNSAFVRDLIAGDGELRWLRSHAVEAAMIPPTGDLPASPTLARHDDLYRALAQLLAAGAERLAVLDGGERVGAIGLEQIRALAAATQPT
jgi:osmoprotectant transport system ATP-binding protein